MNDQEFSLSQSFSLLAQEGYPEVTLWVKASSRANGKSLVRCSFWIKAWNPEGSREVKEKGKTVTKKGGPVDLSTEDLSEENVQFMKTLYTGIVTVLTEKVLENVTLEAQTVQD